MLVIIKIIEINKKNRLIKKFPKMNVIGNKDVVLHGETGYLFDDEEELGGYIKLLLNESHRLSLGKRGLARVERYFDSNKNFKGLEEIYLKH